MQKSLELTSPMGINFFFLSNDIDIFKSSPFQSKIWN